MSFKIGSATIIFRARPSLVKEPLRFRNFSCWNSATLESAFFQRKLQTKILFTFFINEKSDFFKIIYPYLLKFKGIYESLPTVWKLNCLRKINSFTKNHILQNKKKLKLTLQNLLKVISKILISESSWHPISSVCQSWENKKRFQFMSLSSLWEAFFHDFIQVSLSASFDDVTN